MNIKLQDKQREKISFKHSYLLKTRMYILSLGLIFCVLSIQTKAASYHRYEGSSVREACRKQVAGHYLSLYDKSRRSAEFLEYLNIKNKQLQEKIEAKNKEHIKLKNELDTFPFEVEQMEKFTNLESLLSFLNSALKTNLNLKKGQQKILKSYQDSSETFKKSMLKVFKLTPIKGLGIGYRFKLEYIQKCSKYRSNCPLASKYVNAFQKIFAKDETPLPCLRYTGLN